MSKSIKAIHTSIKSWFLFSEDLSATMAIPSDTKKGPQGKNPSDMTPDEIKREKRATMKNIILISLSFLFVFNAFQGLSRLQSSLHITEGQWQAIPATRLFVQELVQNNNKEHKRSSVLLADYRAIVKRVFNTVHDNIKSCKRFTNLWPFVTEPHPSHKCQHRGALTFSW